MASSHYKSLIVLAVLAVNTATYSRSVLSPAIANASPTVIYVAVDGDDAWSGTAAARIGTGNIGPFATLARAQVALRALPAAERSGKGATISIRGGTYHMPTTLKLEELDSGSAGAPTVIEAYHGERVVLSGGRPITRWTQYKGGIFQTNVASILNGARRESAERLPINPINQNEGDRNLYQTHELFCDGDRMELARWPHADDAGKHEGWAMTAGVPVKGSRTQFYYQGEAPKSWAHPELAQVHIFSSFDWHDDYRDIADINSNKHLITLAKPTVYPIEAGRRFYVRNVFEEIDAPCEWYLDTASGNVFLYPPRGSMPKDVELSMLQSVVTLDGARNIQLRGLCLEDVTGAAIEANGGCAIRVDECEIRNTGQVGLCAWNANDLLIERCLIHDTGSDGVMVLGGDRKSLTPSNSFVRNNHIFRFGRLVECYTPGVSIGGVGITVTHNDIHDGPHEAVLLSGNDHDISYNDIHDVCLDTSDCAAIYTGGDWTFRGNTIRYNRIHDIPGFGFQKYDEASHESVYTSRQAQAIYLDDGASGFDVTGNILYRIGLLGVLVGGGRDNRINDNIIVDTYGAISIDARYAPSPAGWSNPGNLVARLRNMPYQVPPWSIRYPALSNPMRNNRWPEGNEVTGNIVANDGLRSKDDTVPWFTADTMASYEVPSDSATIDRNIFWNNGCAVSIKRLFADQDSAWSSLTWNEWRATGFDKTSLSVAPLFVNRDDDDFRLKTSSPAYKLGIAQIPWQAIGLESSFPKEWRPSHAKRKNTTMTLAVKRYPVEVIPEDKDAR